MVNETYIGFDSAWADNAPGAICAVTLRNGRVTDFVAPKLVRFDEATAITERLASASDYTLIALDQPTLVPNSDSNRPVESVANGLLGRMAGAAQPSNRGKTKIFGPDAPVWTFLDTIGARENPGAARAAETGRFLIEVFPALALPSMIPEIRDRNRLPKYNPQRPSFTIDDWRLVTDGVAQVAQTLGVEPIATAARTLHALRQPRKGDQDRLDALICLEIALLFRRDPADRTMVIGDGHHGYMVTPVVDATRVILERSAARKGVSIGADWSQDAVRTPFDEDPVQRAEAPTTRRSRSRSNAAQAGNRESKRCPECGHAFAGHGWGGIDAHWKAHHEDIMPYAEAWPIIRAGGCPSGGEAGS